MVNYITELGVPKYDLRNTRTIDEKIILFGGIFTNGVVVKHTDWF